MSKYYFTFGSEGQPYKGGWLIIEADNIMIAMGIYRAIYPNKDGDILNCADVYTESEFKRTRMYKNNDNLGSACHCEISLKIKKTAERELISGQNSKDI